MEDSKVLRMKAVAALLGISRHSLRRVIQSDPTFPRFFPISPGVLVVREHQVRAWLRRKELDAYEKAASAPTSPN
jgi:predicted DNA-binding transcriptional regulator AlpA